MERRISHFGIINSKYKKILECVDLWECPALLKTALKLDTGYSPWLCMWNWRWGISLRAFTLYLPFVLWNGNLDVIIISLRNTYNGLNTNMSFRQFKLFHTSVCFQLCFFIQFASGRFIVDSSSFRLVTHYKGMHVIWSSTDTWRRRVSLPLTSLLFLLFRWAGKQETNDQYVCNIAITRLSFENRIMIVSVIHDELRSGFTLTSTGKCTKNSVIHKTKSIFLVR